VAGFIVGNLSCPAGATLTAEMQGVAANGGPDGHTLASGSVITFPGAGFGQIRLTTQPMFAADQAFTVVYSADQACAVNPSAGDVYVGEGYLFNGAWQRLKDSADGRFDIPLQELVIPVSGFGFTNTFRGGHTATVLANGPAASNGKVLIAGGGDSSAELYDPATNTFTATGNMNAQRQRHTATLLNDGTVLITGGYNFTGAGGSTVYLTSAELYHPDSGTFELLAAPMSAARSSHTATKLADGRVLITGGFNATTTLQTAEVYQFGSKTFTSTSDMVGSRQAHTATLLNDGRVLVAGGYGSYNTFLQSAETYDPVLNTFTTIAHGLVAFRARHTATLLPNGQVLLAGGTGSPSAELFNGSTFISVGALLTPRVDHTALLLDDGSVLLAGGLDDVTAGCCQMLPPQASLERYVPGIGFVGAGSMTASRYVHTASTVPVSHKILFVGTYGWSFSGGRSAELYTPATSIGLANPIPPDGSNGVPYAGFTLTGTGGSGGPYTIVQQSGSLPDGLLYNATSHIVSGTPTRPGVFTTAFSLGGAPGQAGTQTVTFYVDRASITTVFVPNGTVGTAYNAPLAATGLSPFTWSLWNGALPPGLNLSGAAIAGTPTATGFYSFTIRALDAVGQATYRALSINVP
jgi:hypothetical protein